MQLPPSCVARAAQEPASTYTHCGAIAWVWTQNGDARAGIVPANSAAPIIAVITAPCRQRLVAIDFTTVTSPPGQFALGAASAVPSITSAPA